MTIILLVSLADSTLIALGDYSLPTNDFLITISMPEQIISVTIIADRIAGEPVENFTISFMGATSPGTGDAMFLFRDSVVNIVDEDSK